MPELPILDHEGKLLPMAPVLLMGIMLYPGDVQRRDHFIASSIVRLVSNPDMQISADPSKWGWLVPILHSAPSADEIARKAQRTAENSWIATTALGIMLSAAENHPDQQVDVSRALWALAQVNPDAPSSRTCWRAWKRFRSVAHLDLAIGSLLHHHGPVEGTEFLKFLFHHFVEYLGLSEAVRRTTIDRRFLAFDDPWRVPPRLELRQFTVSFPPLSDPLLAALAAYVPEHADEGVEE